eukprot:992325-Pyramimonas_sp.AAC.3
MMVSHRLLESVSPHYPSCYLGRMFGSRCMSQQRLLAIALHVAQRASPRAAFTKELPTKNNCNFVCGSLLHAWPPPP